MATVAKRVALVAVALGGVFAVYGLVTREPRRENEKGSLLPPSPQEQTPPASSADRQAERNAIRANELAVYRDMSPAERLAAMALHCPPEAKCDKDGLRAIAQAAADGAERTLLSSKADALVAAHDRGPDAGPPTEQGAAPAQIAATAKAVVSERDSFASRFEATLVERQLNPDRVSVTGPNKTTLDVQGFACSDQFLSNIQKSAYGTEARGLGFKRITCSFNQTSASLDL
jgi:hypothetical protein